MKLIKEIIKYCRLHEDLNNLKPGSEYTVYKATGHNTEKTYYGYVKGTGESRIASEFFNRTNSGESNNPEDEKRGINVLINANGGTEGIEFEELAIVDTEEHAFMLRNEEREADSESSVTGPSYFPGLINRRGQEMHPEIHQRMMQTRSKDFSKSLLSCVHFPEIFIKK